MSGKKTNRKKAAKTGRKSKASPVPIIVMFCVMAFFAYLSLACAGLLYKDRIVMNRQLKMKQTQKEEKLQKIKQLEEEHVKLNDPEYVKEIARKDLYYMESNEVHIKITPDPGADNE